MSTDPTLALERLLAAFTEHFSIARLGEDNWEEEELSAAEQKLRDAFFTYDNILFTNFEVELPFDILEDLEDDDDDEELDYILAAAARNQAQAEDEDDDDDDEDDEDEDDEDDDEEPGLGIPRIRVLAEDDDEDYEDFDLR